MDGSMKVMAPSMSLVFVSGSRDALGKQSRNRPLVLPGSPSQPGGQGLVEQESEGGKEGGGMREQGGRTTALQRSGLFST